ncbi:amino acid adenylation domain-containing protein [Saccharothrix sp. ST-888]|uniref:amino acid adenylation domain-containing protein n=1 Tax=Saccharothrix sp. ST-888 TaxID=1427391 RepID=UPI0005EC5761|nr:amino acid adenylation domain-containing protein [Saccharothrix sp. ST-888]KJK55204.1 AMP-dependent synthetase [Saccharothrix sp. ST-888]
MDDTVDVALSGRFLRGLAKSADRPALRAGGTELTYRELHERALLLAGSLLAGLESRPAAIGVLAGKGASAYVAVLAGLYTGITMVPLQPAFPAARTRQMIEASGVGALIADDDSLPVLAGLREAGVDLPVLFPPGGQPMPAVPVQAARALSAPVPVRGEDVAYVLFTSGSTGRPKGVPVTHANTHHYFGLLDERYDFGPEDVFSQNFDLNFDCAMFDLFCAWGSGGTLTVPPPQAYRDMPEFVAAQGLTVWFSTPSAIALVRRMGGLRPGAMPSLRWSFFAGEALSCQDARDWQDAAAGSTLENLYGPTELTITVAAHRWTGEDGLNGMVPIGSVHAGHRVLLLDRAGEEHRTEGELCIAGPQLTAGYLDAGDDAGRFFDRDGRRFYRTGDRVRRSADGALDYLGRDDAQVQVHGVRVELAEVDAAVRTCPGVQDAVTVAVAADGSVELVVFYTGEAVPLVQLARDVRRVLPVAIVPKRYHRLAEFPLNSNRKIDRGQLALQAATTTD